MADIQSRRVSYSASGVDMEGYMAWDSTVSGPRPVVLVVHEWWGLNDYPQRRANMLAELGYLGFAVDMYGSGKVAANPDEAGALMNALLSDTAVARERLQAAIDAAGASELADRSRTAAIGYCMGGGLVLHMARYGFDLAAVGSFHGALPLACAPAGEGGDVRSRIAVYHGEDDSFFTGEQIADFHAEMDSTGADCIFIPYPGALHGFSNPQATINGEKYGLPLAHNERADRSSWDHLVLLLNKSFA